MKKYRIKDAEGEYEIEEVETYNDDEEVEVEETEVLTNDEIIALKTLAARAHELLALIDTTDTEAEDADEEVDFVDADEEVEETEEYEEVVDVKSCDSKKSLGAIERNKTKVDDSLDDDISSAWAKRFGGK